MTNHVRSVFLIRHGRTSYNAAHKLQGQVDIPLDAVGEWQVKQTAAALKRLYVDRRQEINHRFIVCSDLKRAHATAQAFADVLGGIEPVDDRRVRERSFGDWDGHAVAEEIEKDLFLKCSGRQPRSREGLTEGQWVLLDYGDFVVHVMHEESREFYGLERLWRDCPAIDLELAHPETAEHAEDAAVTTA